MRLSVGERAVLATQMTRDYVVIGGGIMGVCTAYHLARSGKSVLLLERQTIAPKPPASSSGDIARIFRTAYGRNRHMTRLAARSCTWWRHFEEESATTFFVPSNMIVFGAAEALARNRWTFPPAAEWSAESFRTMRAEGLSCELLSRSEIRDRHPDIAEHDWYDHALIDRTAGYLHASRAVRAISVLAEKAGLEIRENTFVEKVLREGPHVRGVIANGAEIIVGRAVVFAAGAMNVSLVPELRRKTRVTRQQIVHFRAGPALRDPLQNLPIIISLNDRRYLYAIEGGQVTVADDDHHQLSKVVDPAQPFPGGADVSFWEDAREFVRAFVPALSDLEAVEGKSCLYTSTVSEEYLVYRTGNAVVVSACSGHGFKNGPIIGLMAAQLSTEGQSCLHSEAFSYENAQDFPHTIEEE
jgi:sarcosine oxidase